MTTQPRLAVILHADVVGSTMLVQEDEQVAHERIQATFQRFSQSVQAYGGQVTELRGDAFLAEFARASDAVLAALSAQQTNARANDQLDDNIRPVLRVGIALGEVVYADNTVTGAGVVLAQRLEQLAQPGGICVSAAIREAVPIRLPFDYEDLGTQEAKGFDHPVQTFAITPRDGHPIPPPSRGFTAAKGQRLKGWRFTVMIGVVALVFIGTWAEWELFWRGKNETPLALPDNPSIAVLSFENIGDNPDQEYFSDGFTEDIITELSKFHDLFVIARNSSFKFKGQSVDVRDIAGDLGVRYVLEGSIRRAREKLLINAQLIDATSGSHLWAKRYDVDADELFTIQDDITKEVAATLVAKMRSNEHKRITRKREDTLTAYEYVLQARYLTRSPGGKINLAARELVTKAIDVDPEYAPAYAVLSYTYYLGYAAQWDPPEVLPLAFDAARKAVELDNSLAEGYDMLARVYSRQKRHSHSIAALEKAVSLNPSRAETYASLANTLTFAGRAPEAISAARKAIRLDPFYGGTLVGMYLGRALYFDKQYEEALTLLETCTVLTPKRRSCHMYLAPLYADLGRSEDARNTVTKLLGLAPQFSIEASVKNRLPFEPETMNRYIESLRKAGVPEQ